MKRKVLPLRRPAPSAAVLSDEAVAAACASGDPAAVAELFDRHRVLVARFLSHLVRTPTDAEDLLQATFLEVARGRSRYDGRSAVSTWVLGIAANVARHHLRSAGRQARLRAALRVVASDRIDAGPCGATEARESLERAWRALDALPDERRVAFVLCEIEGLSARVAAQVLGSTETAVWKRVSDARRAIRRALQEAAP